MGIQSKGKYSTEETTQYLLYTSNYYHHHASTISVIALVCGNVVLSFDTSS